MELLAQSGTDGGNTNFPVKKRISGSKKWTFTWNNFPESWLAQLAPVFQGTEWIAEIEIGASGTKHIQGYVEFPARVRPIGYKGCPKEVHWGDKDGKPAKGTLQQNVIYCSKDFREGKEWATEIFGTLKPPRGVKFPPMDRWWQVKILQIILEEPDDRTIHWIWSAAGNLGKTTFCKFLAIKHSACLLAGKGADVRNGALSWKKDKGTYPDVCVFPIPRSFNSDYLSYEAIENVKDALFYSGKYEGGTVADPCPHLFVFSNFAPDEEKMSSDRWKIWNIDEGESDPFAVFE